MACFIDPQKFYKPSPHMPVGAHRELEAGAIALSIYPTHQPLKQSLSLNIDSYSAISTCLGVVYLPIATCTLHTHIQNCIPVLVRVC